MNDDLQNALEQLRCRASGGWEPLHLLPKEAQALLDERDVLQNALRNALDRGYFDPHPDDSAQEADEKAQARAVIKQLKGEA